MGGLLVEIGRAMLAAALSVCWAAPAWLVFGLLERFAPVYGERPSLAIQLKGVLFQVVGTGLGAVPVFLLWHMLPQPRPLWPALWLPAAILIGDFFMYWEHRFEHRFAWAVHAVHHSSRELSGTSNFNHFSHSLLMQVVYGVPVMLLTRDPFAIPLMTALLYADATFVHSPTKLGIGPLRWIFNDNHIHRVHHAIGVRDKNFGAVFTFWDFLFGTMRWPDGWPEVGVSGEEEITTLREFIGRPFRGATLTS